MSDDIKADGEQIKMLAQQMHAANVQVQHIQEWLAEFNDRLGNICGPTHEGYKQIRQNINYGQRTLLGDYIKWMNNVAQEIDQLGDRTLNAGM